jgi:hypothetical protein
MMLRIAGGEPVERAQLVTADVAAISSAWIVASRLGAVRAA